MPTKGIAGVSMIYPNETKHPCDLLSVVVTGRLRDVGVLLSMLADPQPKAVNVYRVEQKVLKPVDVANGFFYGVKIEYHV